MASLSITSSASTVRTGETALITFQFSEALAEGSFTASDITVTGGTLSALTAGSVANSYTATFTPTDGVIQNAQISVAANAASDLAGNGSTAASRSISVATATAYAIANSSPAVALEGTSSSDLTTYSFEITRSGDTRAAGTVTWAVQDNTNTPAGKALAADFDGDTLPFGTVSFAANQSSQTIEVSVKQDATFEVDEAFTVALSQPTVNNGTPLLAIGASSIGAVIANDDAPPPRPVVNNPAFDLIGLTDLRNDPQYSAIDGKAPILIGQSTETYKNFTIAVLDSGVDGTHDRLKDNFKGYVDFVNSNNGGGGPASRTISNNPDDFVDNIGHGTHVAGTIGSSDPAIGVAPGVQLLGLRVGDQTMKLGDIEDALQWVLENRSEHNIVAVNMSLGFEQYYNQRPDGGNDPLYNRIRSLISNLEDAGITVISAAGNDYFSNHADDGFRENIAIPAIASSLAVGAVWKDGSVRNVQWGGGSVDLTTGADRITSFSQRLSSYDGMLFAPGAFIPSTVPGNAVENKGGTSMSSPIVAGAVALLQDAALTFGQRLLTPREVSSILERTAQTIFDGDDENTNVTASFKDYRRMDLYSAVKQVEAMFQAPEYGGSNTLYYFTYNYGNGDSYSGYGYAANANSIYATGINPANPTVANVTTDDEGTNVNGTGRYTITGTLLDAKGTPGQVFITSYNDDDTGAGLAGTVYGSGTTGLGSEVGDAFLANGEAFDSSFSPSQEADLVENAYLDIQKYNFIYRYSDKLAYSVDENTLAAALLAGDGNTFKIVGGADADLFQISDNGLLSFKGAPNFEAPTDADQNNAYRVNVQASETAFVDGSQQTVGVLRELTLTVADLMVPASELAGLSPEAPLAEVIGRLTEGSNGKGSLGAAWVQAAHNPAELAGLITDGDLRRTLQRHAPERWAALRAGAMATANPITVAPATLAVAALELMERNPRQAISVLPVVDPAQPRQLLGLLRLHDLVQAGFTTSTAAERP